MTKKQGSRTGRRNSATPARLTARVNRLESGLAKNPKHINPTVASFSGDIRVNNALVLCLNAVAQGTTENTRIGAKLKMNHLSLAIEVFANFTAQSASNLGFAYRLYIVREKTTLGSDLSPSQFLVDANPNAFSMRNHTTRDSSRFVVLHDSGPIELGPAQSALASPFANLSVRPINAHRIEINLGDIITDYTRGNAGTVADIDTNGISLLIVTDNTVASGIGAYGAYDLKFTDV